MYCSNSTFVHGSKTSWPWSLGGKDGLVLLSCESKTDGILKASASMRAQDCSVGSFLQVPCKTVRQKLCIKGENWAGG